MERSLCVSAFAASTALFPLQLISFIMQSLSDAAQKSNMCPYLFLQLEQMLLLTVRVSRQQLTARNLSSLHTTVVKATDETCVHVSVNLWRKHVVTIDTIEQYYTHIFNIDRSENK